MGTKHCGDVHIVMQALDPNPQILANLSVQCAQELIEQQHLQIYRQGSSQHQIDLKAPTNLKPLGHIVAHSHVLKDNIMSNDAAALRQHLGNVATVIVMVSVSGWSRPAMMRSSVNLPEPLGPNNAISKLAGTMTPRGPRPRSGHRVCRRSRTMIVVRVLASPFIGHLHVP